MLASLIFFYFYPAILANSPIQQPLHTFTPPSTKSLQTPANAAIYQQFFELENHIHENQKRLLQLQQSYFYHEDLSASLEIVYEDKTYTGFVLQQLQAFLDDEAIFSVHLNGNETANQGNWLIFTGKINEGSHKVEIRSQYRSKDLKLFTYMQQYHSEKTSRYPLKIKASQHHRLTITAHEPWWFFKDYSNRIDIAWDLSHKACHHPSCDASKEIFLTDKAFQDAAILKNFDEPAWLLYTEDHLQSSEQSLTAQTEIEQEKWLEDAKSLRRIGRHQQAALLFQGVHEEKVASKNPDPQLLYDMAQSELASDQMISAHEHLAAYLLSKSKNSLFLEKALEQFLKLSLQHQEQRYVDKIIERHQGKAYFHARHAYLYAQILYQQGNRLQTLQYILLIPESHPLYLKGQYLLAQCFIADNDLQKASEMFLRLWQLHHQGLAWDNTLQAVDYYENGPEVLRQTKQSLARLLYDRRWFFHAARIYALLLAEDSHDPSLFYEAAWNRYETARISSSQEAFLRRLQQSREHLETLAVFEQAIPPKAELLRAKILLNENNLIQSQQLLQTLQQNQNLLQQQLQSFIDSNTAIAWLEETALRREGQTLLPPWLEEESQSLGSFQHSMYFSQQLHSLEQQLRQSWLLFHRLEQAQQKADLDFLDPSLHYQLQHLEAMQQLLQQTSQLSATTQKDLHYRLQQAIQSLQSHANNQQRLFEVNMEQARLALNSLQRRIVEFRKETKPWLQQKSLDVVVFLQQRLDFIQTQAAVYQVNTFQAQFERDCLYQDHHERCSGLLKKAIALQENTVRKQHQSRLPSIHLESLADSDLQLAELYLLQAEEEDHQAYETERTTTAAIWQKAIASLEALYQFRPNYHQSDRVLYLLGYASLGHQADSQTIDAWQKLVDNYPQSPYLAETHMRLAELYFYNKRYDLAQEHYQALLALDETTWHEKALYKLSWSQYAQAQQGNAAIFYPEALSNLKLLLQQIALHTQTQQEKDSDLQTDAIKEAALIYASPHWSGLEALLHPAADWLAMLKSSQQQRALLLKTTHFLQQQQRLKDAMVVLQYACHEDPLHPNNPGLSLQIMAWADHLDEPNQLLPQSLAEQSRLDALALYTQESPWFVHNQQQKDAMLQRHQVQLQSYHFLAIAKEHQAQQAKAANEQILAKRLYQEAATFYGHWALLYSPQGPNDLQPYQLRYQASRCFYEAELYEAAAKQAIATQEALLAHNDLQAKKLLFYTSYAACQSYAMAMQAALSHKSPETLLTALSAEEIAFVQATDTWQQLQPCEQATGCPKEMSHMLWLAAQRFEQHHQYKEAQERLHALLKQPLDDKLWQQAAKLLLAIAKITSEDSRALGCQWLKDPQTRSNAQSILPAEQLQCADF